MNRNAILVGAWPLLVLLALAAAAEAQPPGLPPQPVMQAFTAGKVDEGRKAAADNLARALGQLPAEADITVLDPAAVKHFNSLFPATGSLSAWMSAEAFLLYRGGNGEDFVVHAWAPLLTATKTTVSRMDKASSQAQKLLDGAVGDDEVAQKLLDAAGGSDYAWKKRIWDWRLFRSLTVSQLCLLAKKAGRPDLVKEVFAFAGPLGPYATAEPYLAAAEGSSTAHNLFGLDLGPPAQPVLTPEEDKAVREVLELWLTAVENKDAKAFAALYADAGQAERLLESGLIENFSFRQTRAGAGNVDADREADGSLRIRFDCPAQWVQGNETQYHATFDLIARNGAWLFQNREDDGVSLARKNEMKKVLAAWFAAMDAGDAPAAARLFADPAAVQAALVKVAAITAGQHTDLRTSVYRFHLQPDGQIAVRVLLTMITDPAGKQRVVDADLAFVIQEGRCQLTVPKGDAR